MGSAHGHWYVVIDGEGIEHDLGFEADALLAARCHYLKSATARLAPQFYEVKPADGSPSRYVGTKSAMRRQGLGLYFPEGK